MNFLFFYFILEIMELFEENGYLFLKKVYSSELITHYIELIHQLWASQNLESHIYKKYDVENEHLIVKSAESLRFCSSSKISLITLGMIPRSYS